MRIIIKYGLLLIVVSIISFGFKIFLGSLFKIPTESMATTLLPGDVVFVSKFGYGSNNIFSYYRSVRNKDVIVFSLKDNIKYAKRVFALPGDVVRKDESFLHLKKFKDFFLNKSIDSVRFNNNIVMKDDFSSSDEFLNYNGFKFQSKKNQLNDKISLMQGKDIIVPNKGLKISLNESSYKFYCDVILDYEDIYIKFKKSSYYINDSLIDSYEFTKNYYFVLGDNIDNSIDSRSFGFVCEENIIGKVKYILYSRDSSGFNWNRIVKKVE